jgi:hypothetical protein
MSTPAPVLILTFTDLGSAEATKSVSQDRRVSRTWARAPQNLKIQYRTTELMLPMKCMIPSPASDLPQHVRVDLRRGRLPGMIFGLHVLLYSKDADADRAFFRDVLGLNGIDVGGGWLIFRTPPAEMAVHPIDEAFTQSHGDIQ